jgi:hypothetical protein
VQRRQHQVTGLRELDAVLHRLAFADLADQDHVRRLAQGVLERRVPAIGVDADLAVRDHAALVGVHVLDRVLDRDDVAAGLLVAVAHHRGERRGLARAGAPHHDHQSALGEHHLAQDRRQVQLLEGGDLGVDGANHAAGVALLHEGADAKAPDPGRRDGEIAFLGGVEFLRLAVAHDRAHQDRRLLAGQGAVHLRADLAIHLDGRGEAGGQEQVGGPFLDHAAEQLLHELDGLFAIHQRESLFWAL